MRLSGLGPPARQDHRYAAPAAPQNIGRAEKSKSISLTLAGGSLVRALAALMQALAALMPALAALNVAYLLA